MANVDYSRVAKAYRWLEVLVFSSTLQKARLSHLEALVQKLSEVKSPSIAVVGDGDGRFLAELLRSQLDFKIDYIDCSPGMLQIARERVGDDPRVSWRCEKFDGMQNAYDAITCHFVLDGFEPESRKRFVASIAASLKTNGILLVSDFDSKAHRGAAALVLCMQWFFHSCAGVPIVEVSKPDPLLIAHEMTKLGEMNCWKGAIFSQIWKM